MLATPRNRHKSNPPSEPAPGIRGAGRRCARAAVAVAVLVAAVVGGVLSAQPVAAAPSEPTSFVVSGTGNGHGRGLSQWGAYGRAINGYGHVAILNSYYGGTTQSQASNTVLRVRLTKWDNSATLGVVSRTRQLGWSATGATGSATFASVYAVETSANRFDVYGAPTALQCPSGQQLSVPNGTFSTASPRSDAVEQIQAFLNAFGFDAGPVDGIFGRLTQEGVRRFQTARGLPVTGVWTTQEYAAALALMATAPNPNWEQLATGVAGPVTFSLAGEQETTSAADTLGVCSAAGEVGHYRGAVELRDDPSGNRVVNSVRVESYLRGVVPKEVPASWGNTSRGMNALRAQAVAARSYALSERRYSYASTCDTTSCQVYGGAGRRNSPTASFASVERATTDQALRDTAGQVRRWPGGTIVRAEFSASNGPRTAGGAFPAIDDPYDRVAGNSYHTWTRTLSATQVAQAFRLGSVSQVATEVDPGSRYDGIWKNRVRLDSQRTVTAWQFRNAMGLPSPGFTIRPVFAPTTNSCMPAAYDTLAFVGDSVGVGVAGSANSPLRRRIGNAFRQARFDVLKNRATRGGSVQDGVTAAANVPVGTEVVVVELGYNDLPSQLGPRVDAMMQALGRRSVKKVLWVNLSERRSQYAQANRALDAAAKRWTNLDVLDWRSASASRDAWFVDGVHLTTSGNDGFTSFLVQHIAQATGVKNGSCLSWSARRLGAKQTLRVPVLGRAGVPASLSQVKGVAINVTAVNPSESTHLKVWECGTREPGTSSVNFEKGSDTPNLVVLPLTTSGQVCVWAYSATDVIVDINGWFDNNSGLRAATGRLLDTRSTRRAAAGQVIRVPLLGRVGVPRGRDQVQAVALNIVAVQASTLGHLTVWECGQREPNTSSVNFAARRDASNAVVLGLRGSGVACIRPSTSTDLVVDVSGWFDSRADLHPIERRLYDSRRGPGRLRGQSSRPVSLGAAVTAPGGVSGVLYNVTAVQPSGYGHFRVWKCGTEKPPTSSVNYEPRTNVPNAVVVSMSNRQQLCVWTVTDADLVVDAVAAFGPNSGLHAASARLIDTRIATG